VSAVTRPGRVAPIAAVALGVLTIGLTVANVPLDRLAHQPGNALDYLAAVSLEGTGAAVGALLAARRPRNPIGWLLLLIFLTVASPYGQYAILDYRMHHGSLPLGGVAVVLLADWPVWIALIAILLWLFPDGRLPAGRWRPAVAALLTAAVLLGLTATAALALAVAGHRLPVGAAGNLTAQPAGGWAVLTHVTGIALWSSLVIWLIVQVPRYRRAPRERRQQLKWLYGGALVFLVGVVLPPSPWWLSDVGEIMATALPVCIGVAVLKYRLYEIDRIISRVIAYAIITAVPAGVFAGLVVLATQVLPVRTPVAVAASTLVAAALFNPLRRRVQHAVDRRFNRARYDAEAVVADFTARLRHTVDLDMVRGDLVGAVHAAFEPAHVSVWLTAGTGSGRP
jgi:MFS family permease